MQNVKKNTKKLLLSMRWYVGVIVFFLPIYTNPSQFHTDTT